MASTHHNHTRTRTRPHPHGHPQTSNGEGQCEVEWWFGEGLSYTTFDYGAPEVTPKTIHDGQSFRVSF